MKCTCVLTFDLSHGVQWARHLEISMVGSIVQQGSWVTRGFNAPRGSKKMSVTN